MLVKEIDLTPAERDLLAQLKFDTSASSDGDQVRSNGELACNLMHSLLRRDAIPEARLGWFFDPDYNATGRESSQRDVFIRSGRQDDDDIFRHPKFLKYLRYFLSRADLPHGVKLAFAQRVARCGHVKPGDVIPLGDFARACCRDLGLQQTIAAEEFYKLALDLALDRRYAESIRRALMQGRWWGC
jgi:hypothetical protein